MIELLKARISILFETPIKEEERTKFSDGGKPYMHFTYLVIKKLLHARTTRAIRYALQCIKRRKTKKKFTSIPNDLISNNSELFNFLIPW